MYLGFIMSKFYAPLCVILILCGIDTVYTTVAPLCEDPDFEALTKCSAFVDKTLMIETFFNHSNPWKFHLISCPRKFGKSVNIDMMKRFVQIEVDDSGKVKKKEDTSNYRLFTNPSLDLQIAQCKTTIKDHLAEYPVIYLEFHNITDSTFDMTLSKLRQKIKKCYETYNWLFEILNQKYPAGTKKSVQTEQLAFMKRVMNEELSLTDVPDSLDILSRILHGYFKKKVFVFVDEYDTPLVDAITKNVDFDVTQIITLISNMIQKILKTSTRYSFVEYAFISGITNTLAPLFISKTKQMYLHRFLNNHAFAKYYGLVQQEVDDLLRAHNFNTETGKEILKYYKGYFVKEMALELFNTYSITKYLTQTEKNVSYPAYWAETGSINFLKKFTQNDNVYDKLSHLVLLKEVQFKLMPCVPLEDLKTLFGNVGNDIAKNVDVNVIFSYLFESGYLSYTEQTDVYRIPNDEIETAFSYYLFDFYGKNLGPEAQSIGEELKKILDSSHVTRKMLIELKTLLQNLIPKAENLISSHVEKEFHYHSLIYYSAKKFHSSTSAEVRMLCEDSKLAPNTKKIKRRADIVMVNQDKTIMMIIEIKSNLTAKNALEVAQMYKPTEEMHKPKIIKYMGINFKKNMSEVGYTYDIVRDTAIFADDNNM